jgi:hypothetical protein
MGGEMCSAHQDCGGLSLLNAQLVCGAGRRTHQLRMLSKVVGGGVDAGGGEGLAGTGGSDGDTGMMFVPFPACVPLPACAREGTCGEATLLRGRDHRGASCSGNQHKQAWQGHEHAHWHAQVQR